VAVGRPLLVRLIASLSGTLSADNGRRLQLSLNDATSERRFARDLCSPEGIRVRPAGFWVELDGVPPSIRLPMRAPGCSIEKGCTGLAMCRWTRAMKGGDSGRHGHAMPIGKNLRLLRYRSTD